MHVATIRRASGLALLGLLVSTAASAQDDVRTHVMQLADVSGDTPTGQGLLPTAVAEAAIAAQHARLAGEEPANLDGMRRHAGHALHALDPSAASGGPGLGYGVKRATAGAALQVELAAGSEGASENVTFHALHIATALGNVTQWTDEAIGLAQRIQSAPSTGEAAQLVSRLDLLCRAITLGRDVDRDGLVGWRQGEGGLAQATYHMNALKRGEGFGP
jgi:hypothetical protein